MENILFLNFVAPYMVVLIVSVSVDVGVGIFAGVGLSGVGVDASMGVGVIVDVGVSIIVVSISSPRRRKKAFLFCILRIFFCGCCPLGVLGKCGYSLLTPELLPMITRRRSPRIT